MTKTNTDNNNKEIKMEKVSGRVLAVEPAKKNKKKLFIGSHKFGTMVVKATLPDSVVEGIQRNDEVQLSGKLKLRKWITTDGTIVRDVLVMEPELERVIRLKQLLSISKKGND